MESSVYPTKGLISLVLFLFTFQSLSQVNSTVIGRGAFGTYYGANRNYNVHIGYQAGWSGNTGNGYNIYIGAQSGFRQTSAVNNSFLGYQSGYNNTSGNSNLFLGYRSGYKNTTGSSNIFIGYRSGWSNTTGSNKLFIHNSDTSDPLIWGDFNSRFLTFHGKVGINDKTPSYPLDVSGDIRSTGTIRTNAHKTSANWEEAYDKRINSVGTGLTLSGNKISVSASGFPISSVSGNLNANGYFRANYHDVNSGNGRGIRFWNSDSYKIHMGNTTEYKYGPVQDYSIKHNMNNDGDRGWTWGITGAIPVAALNTQGQMQIKSNFTTEGNIYGKYVNNQYSNLYRFGGLYLTWDSNSYGTNNHHSIRSTYGDTYGDDMTINTFHHLRINLDANNNNSDAVFEIGNNSTGTSNTLLRFTESGKLGIGTGTNDPASKLHVNGRITANSIAGLDLAGGGISGNNYNISGVKELIIDNSGKGINFSSDQKMYVIDDASDDKFYIGPGNVGIGLTPAEKLHINGAVRGHVSGGALEIKSTHGSVIIGAQNADWSHFSTDRPKYYFNKGVIVDQGIIASYDEDLELRTDFSDGNILGVTISGTTGNTIIHNDLEVEGGVKLNKLTVVEDNSQDDLLVMRGDGTFASRSVASIESPWLFAEILVGQDSMLAICPDAGVIGQVSVDVIDLNGNLRFGDNAYIDDDLDYGDNGDNDDIPDDWMKFSDRIEFKSSAADYGIVLFDQTSFSDFLNLHHSAGTSYLSNGSEGSNYFMKAIGRNVEFGGTVNIPSLETSEYSSMESLTISADRDNNSADEAIVFGTDGNAGEATFNEIMRLEEDGSIYTATLADNTTIDNLVVQDQTTGKLYSRPVSTVGPWTQEQGSLTYSGNIGVGLSAGSATQNLDLSGTARLRGLASNTLTDEILVADVNGVIHKRNYSSFSPWKLHADNGYFSTNRIGIGAENLDTDVSTNISTDLGTGLSVYTSKVGSDVYGIRSTVSGNEVKAIAALNTISGNEVFRVYGSGVVEAKEVLVSVDIWNDHVFYPQYNLMPLEKVEEFVKENHHLPEIPTEKEVLENGVNLGEMEGLLLKKVEELTLYIIEQNKRLKEQAELLKKQTERIEKLESQQR